MALTRTAKSCGSDAPMLASSLREEAQMTVSNKPGHRGEREVSRKTIARGMPGRFRCDRGDYARVLCFILHARLRAHQAPGIPCALCFLRGRTSKQNSRERRGEIAKPCLPSLRGAKRRAIHSSFAAPWIASRSLSSGAHSRDPLARNDGRWCCLKCESVRPSLRGA